jgi:hypothetical protein
VIKIVKYHNALFSFYLFIYLFLSFYLSLSSSFDLMSSSNLVYSSLVPHPPLSDSALLVPSVQLLSDFDSSSTSLPVLLSLLPPISLQLWSLFLLAVSSSLSPSPRTPALFAATSPYFTIPNLTTSSPARLPVDRPVSHALMKGSLGRAHALGWRSWVKPFFGMPWRILALESVIRRITGRPISCLVGEAAKLL